MDITCIYQARRQRRWLYSTGCLDRCRVSLLGTASETARAFPKSMLNWESPTLGEVRYGTSESNQQRTKLAILNGLDGCVDGHPASLSLPHFWPANVFLTDEHWKRSYGYHFGLAIFVGLDLTVGPNGYGADRAYDACFLEGLAGSRSMRWHSALYLTLGQYPPGSLARGD